MPESMMNHTDQMGAPEFIGKTASAVICHYLDTPLVNDSLTLNRGDYEEWYAQVDGYSGQTGFDVLVTTNEADVATYSEVRCLTAHDRVASNPYDAHILPVVASVINGPVRLRANNRIQANYNPWMYYEPHLDTSATDKIFTVWSMLDSEDMRYCKPCYTLSRGRDRAHMADPRDIVNTTSTMLTVGYYNGMDTLRDWAMPTDGCHRPREQDAIYLDFMTPEEAKVYKAESQVEGYPFVAVTQYEWCRRHHRDLEYHEFPPIVQNNLLIGYVVNNMGDDQVEGPKYIAYEYKP